MSTKTTNYKLIKPQESDFYNVKDFNDNADTIDEEIKRVEKITSQKLNASGGTITGRMKMEQDYYVHSAIGTSGADGYILIAQIKILGNHMDAPIEFNISQRRLSYNTKILIRFISAESLDPSLASFTCEGSNSGIHLHKSATSTWNLYVEKKDSWDNISVTSLKTPKYMQSYISIVSKDSQVSMPPDGCVKATLATNITNITGTSSAANKLVTARKINSILFNGESDITIEDDTKLPLSGGTMTGNPVLANDVYLCCLDKDGTAIAVFGMDESNSLLLGNKSYPTIIRGSVVLLSGGFTTDGNITVGDRLTVTGFADMLNSLFLANNKQLILHNASGGNINGIYAGSDNVVRIGDVSYQTLIKGSSITINDGIFTIDSGDIRIKSARMLNDTANSNSRVRLFPATVNTNLGVSLWFTSSIWTLSPCVDIQCSLGASTYRYNNLYLNNSPIITSDANLKDIKDSLINNELWLTFLNRLEPMTYTLINGDSGRVHHGLIAQKIESLMEELGIDSKDFAGFIKSPKIVSKTKIVTKTRMVTKSSVKTEVKDIFDKKGNPVYDAETGEQLTEEVKAVINYELEEEYEEEEMYEEEIPGEYVYSLRYEEFTPMVIAGYQDHEDRIIILENEVAELKETVNEQAKKMADLEARLQKVELLIT